VTESVLKEWARGVILKDDGTTGQGQTTGQHGHRRAVIRATGGRPVALLNDDGTDAGHNRAVITPNGVKPVFPQIQPPKVYHPLVAQQI